MKRSLIIIFIMLLLSIAYFIISGNGIYYEESSNLTEISPFSKDYVQTSKLYFVNNLHLVSEMRTISVEMLESELAVLKALKKGPKITTYTSPIKDDVQLLSVDTTDRICYVNLSSEFSNEDEATLYLNAMAIVNSLVEFESIDFVQILVEGKKIIGGKDRLDQPLPKNTSLVGDIELQHKDIVKKFLEYVTQSRYDLAFDLIDSESKKHATFRDFKESAAVIKNDIKGYSQIYTFAKREQGRYIIEVKYVLRDSPSTSDIIRNSNVPEELIFSWPVIQEDGIWKVQYFGY